MAADDVIEPVLQVTDAARALISEARAGEPEPEHLALFLEVSGAADGAYTYDMWFEKATDAGPRDAVHPHDDLTVVVAAASIAQVRGATLDVNDGGLAMLNPNTPPEAQHHDHEHLEVPTSDLSSPLELAVLEVLEQEINPQIASHGGRADLVAVDDGVAYLRLSGGCQGCGMAEVTLTQGISVAIKEAVPEIVEIVDVTQHESGENPYFASAKK
ncbi:MAG TPA: NifU family protein [Acidimicrobiales bacterium]|nr:NifU family protein [Acidimicrobiales bacterium]